MELVIHIDGGSRGNPGPAAAGVVIRTADDDTVIHTAGVFLGRGTNNFAEYSALLEGLRRATTLGATDVKVFSDSELLVKQLRGEYRVKNENLRPLFEEANQLASTFDSFDIAHVRREENRQADALVNKALNVKRNVEE
jgi:ribonuclease HI